MDETVTLPGLQAMKRDGRKIVGVVAWDYQMARIADLAGVDIVSVGDSVGINLWGRSSPLDVTLDEMVLVCRAVRGGVTRALVSCDFPFGPLQEGPESAVKAAVRLIEEGGADLVKLDAAVDYLDGVRAVERAGIPVFAQLGITPQTSSLQSVEVVPAALKDELVSQARVLEQAGASLLDFTNSGPVIGPEVVGAVSIPVVGGMGGGPWLDGRMRMAHAAIGYAASGLDDPPDTYANVARVTFDALTAYAGDVRAGRQVRGGIPVTL
jgi:3-methyl-2-oxobutanoate hydroxymethyltransferase